MSTAKINNLSNIILRETVPAANADLMRVAGEVSGEGAGLENEPGHTATGWDSYEVWRKFIKEAREKRLSE